MPCWPYREADFEGAAAASETLSNRGLRADAQAALVLVREGAPLASALAQKKRFPPLLAMFARLGGQTGQLPLMLIVLAVLMPIIQLNQLVK